MSNPQRKLTPKQYAFVLAYLDTGNASEAYRRAYDVKKGTKGATITRKAHELVTQSNIAAMIDEEQRRLKEAHDYDVEQAHSQFLEALAIARREGDADAIRKITVDMNKLHGLLVERKRVSVDGQIDHVNTMKAVRAHLEGRKRGDTVTNESAKVLEYKEVS